MSITRNAEKEPEMRRYCLPGHLSLFIEQQLIKTGFSLSNPRSLARAILSQSDFYIEHPQQETPWRDHDFRAAQMAYYFPLNWIRAQAVLDRGAAVGFWHGIDSYLEFGSGLGPFTCQDKYFKTGLCVEPAMEALEIAKKLARHLGIMRPVAWESKFEKKKLPDAAIFSYVLTELPQLPLWSHEIKNLVIVEPSTQKDGRQLMNVRDTLIKEGYYPWAPCVHGSACPLLAESKKDWCHDRVRFDAPPWWLAMEKHLPMRNRTITFSYLLMKKEKPAHQPGNIARLIGDSLVEKGKTRQMFCRDSHRKFLSWLHKDAGTFELPRGEIVLLPEDAVNKGSEVRIRQIPKCGPSQ